MQSVNSVNLERINQRNMERLARLDGANPDAAFNGSSFFKNSEKKPDPKGFSQSSFGGANANVGNHVGLRTSSRQSNGSSGARMPPRATTQHVMPQLSNRSDAVPQVV